MILQALGAAPEIIISHDEPDMPVIMYGHVTEIAAQRRYQGSIGGLNGSVYRLAGRRKRGEHCKDAREGKSGSAGQLSESIPHYHIPPYN
jgi:hypothetical protein